jgi:hypothetical protein
MTKDDVKEDDAGKYNDPIIRGNFSLLEHFVWIYRLIMFDLSKFETPWIKYICGITF